MPQAYVLFNVESGSEKQVLNELRQFENVEESFVTYGQYDLMALLQANTMEEIKNLITYKIRRIDKVKATMTLVVF